MEVNEKTLDNNAGLPYDAFLSYNSKDVLLAEKLSRRIRRYVPPKRAGLGEKKLEIFRDIERLTSSDDLNYTLREKVLGSRYLILLCTPNTTNSLWINEEVKIFLEKNKAKSIIFVLARGELNSCLPKVLRTSEPDQEKPGGPLYINIIDAGRKKFRNESLRLIAALYGVEFNLLLREDEARRRRTIRQLTISLVLFLLLVFSIFLVFSVEPVYWKQIEEPEVAGPIILLICFLFRKLQ